MSKKEDRGVLTEKIAQQIKDYLATGNRIQYIPRGVTMDRETKKYDKGWKPLPTVIKRTIRKENENG